MARTNGHGNPKWTRDETILALDLYLQNSAALPRSDPRVKELSELLQRLPYHSGHRTGTFRNIDGVAFKLQNLRQVATGRGLTNVSQADRSLWSQLGTQRDLVSRIAERIRVAAELTAQQPDVASGEEDEEFFEGRILTAEHRRRERNPRVRARLIALRRDAGNLACEMCSRQPVTDDPLLEDAIYEAHHIVPLAIGLAKATKIRDMALLCAACHRLVHRLIRVHKRWMTPSQCKETLSLR